MSPKARGGTKGPNRNSAEAAMCVDAQAATQYLIGRNPKPNFWPPDS